MDEEYIEQAMRLIGAWKQEEPGVVSWALGQVVQPLTWAVQQLIPEGAIRGVLDGLDWVAKNSTTSQGSQSLDDLRGCDNAADSVINVHIAAAAVEGGAAGFFGIITLPADIPAIILVALRLIRQIGVEYGYSEDNEAERAFARTILSAAGANSQAEKVEALGVASMVLNKLTKETWKAMASRAATQQIGLDAAIIGTRNLAKSLGINLTKRKALAALPIIGAAVGAGANGWYIREVGIAAQRNFQERWMRDRNIFIDGEASESEGPQYAGGESGSAISEGPDDPKVMAPLMTTRMYGRLSSLSHALAEADGDAANVFVPVAPIVQDPRLPKILFIGQATRDWSDDRVNTYERAARTAERLVCTPLTHTAFWQAVIEITRKVMAAVDVPFDGDLSKVIGWSNVLKIGHPHRNPAEPSWKIQAELCVEQLRFELETMKPTAVVLMAGNIAEHEVIDSVFGVDGWRHDSVEQDRVAWKTYPVTVVWTQHPTVMSVRGHRASSIAKAVQLISDAYLGDHKDSL